MPVKFHSARQSLLRSRLQVLVTLALSAGAAPAFAETGAPAAAAPHVAGLVTRVADLERGLEFYREVAGFDEVAADRAAGHATLVNGEVVLWLLDVESPVAHDYPGATEAHLNLQVARLDELLADLARRGVPRLLAEPRVSRVGPSMPITDPAGNILYLIERADPADPLPRPKAFNFGITVPEMAAARKFYEGVLGFQTLSEAYYPPAIPFLPAGVIQVVLHETATKAAPAPSALTAQVNLVFRVDDLAAARQDLEARGGTLRAPTASAAFGAHAELLDPFGNVHLIVDKNSPLLAGGGTP